ncbi:MAG TPA: PIN domain-containing protein [Solirubrobacteraceae bacterium]|nr:PIN domain-containing protein [Solirubrobacteraceae bacterium]
MIAPDSSVVIAALAPWHEAHSVARDALANADARLPAHVAFETTSALSRLPEGHRIAPAVVLDALGRAFKSQWLALDARGHRDALVRAVDAGVRGGALYDALIAATAAAHGAQIVSADRRARATYAAMSADVRFIEP